MNTGKAISEFHCSSGGHYVPETGKVFNTRVIRQMLYTAEAWIRAVSDNVDNIEIPLQYLRNSSVFIWDSSESRSWGEVL